MSARTARIEVQESILGKMRRNSDGKVRRTSEVRRTSILLCIIRVSRDQFASQGMKHAHQPAP
jgi:hypothetical protein